MTYVSSRERLSALPDVFSMALLQQTHGLTPSQAKTYASRWMKEGLIQSAGPRAGVYYNLSTSSTISDAMKIKALLSLYPSATLIGESVLHAWGWSTQIPQHLSVAVLSQPRLKAIDGVCLHPRPRAWFKKHFDVFLDSHQDHGATTFGLKSLPPAWALVDAYIQPNMWKPDVDDLELDEDEVIQALQALPSVAQKALPENLQDQLQLSPQHHKFRL